MNAFLEFVAVNAVVAMILALVAALITRFVRRPPLSHALWTLVLLKLLVPPLFHIPFTVDVGWPEVEVVRDIPVPQSDIRGIQRPTEREANVLSPKIASVDGLVNDTTSVEWHDETIADATSTTLIPTETGLPSEIAKYLSSISFAGVIALLWAIGSLAWIANALRHTRAFRRHVETCKARS